MMNRFIIHHAHLFKYNIDDVLSKIKNISIDRDSIHLIVDEASIDELDVISKSNELSGKFRVYRGFIDIIKSDAVLNDSTLYIRNISSDSLLENKILYYIQSIDGWSALFPYKNSLVRLDENLNMYVRDDCIGNLTTGIIIDESKLNAKFIGLNGYCYKCLNPLCNHTNLSNSTIINNMVDESECKHKQIVLNDIPMEVQEMTKQQMIYVLEVLTEVMRNSDTSINVLGELISKVSDVDGSRR